MRFSVHQSNMISYHISGEWMDVATVIAPRSLMAALLKSLMPCYCLLPARGSGLLPDSQCLTLSRAHQNAVILCLIRQILNTRMIALIIFQISFLSSSLRWRSEHSIGFLSSGSDKGIVLFELYGSICAGHTPILVRVYKRLLLVLRSLLLFYCFYSSIRWL